MIEDGRAARQGRGAGGTPDEVSPTFPVFGSEVREVKGLRAVRHYVVGAVQVRTGFMTSGGIWSVQ
jgi:hypothetical protein